MTNRNNDNLKAICKAMKLRANDVRDLMGDDAFSRSKVSAWLRAEDATKRASGNSNASVVKRFRPMSDADFDQFCAGLAESANGRGDLIRIDTSDEIDFDAIWHTLEADSNGKAIIVPERFGDLCDLYAVRVKVKGVMTYRDFYDEKTRTLMRWNDSGTKADRLFGPFRDGYEDRERAEHALMCARRHDMFSRHPWPCLMFPTREQAEQEIAFHEEMEAMDNDN